MMPRRVMLSLLTASAATSIELCYYRKSHIVVNRSSFAAQQALNAIRKYILVDTHEQIYSKCTRFGTSYNQLISVF